MKYSILFIVYNTTILIWKLEIQTDSDFVLYLSALELVIDLQRWMIPLLKISEKFQRYTNS